MIHLIFGQAAMGSLRHALRRTNDLVIGFPIDFAVGPIQDIETKAGLGRHFTWLREHLQTTWSDFDGDEIKMGHAWQRLGSLKADQTVTIWVSENAAEQIGLRLCLYVLRQKNITYQLINTTFSMQENEKMDMTIRHTGECSPEQLLSFYQQQPQLLSVGDISTYVADGANLLQADSCLRSWDKGEIVHEPIDKYDAFIIANAKALQETYGERTFCHVARLVGEVIGHVEQPLSDLWIEYRIRTLIQKGIFVANTKELQFPKYQIYLR